MAHQPVTESLASIGLIGFGNIARLLVPVLAERLPAPLQNIAVLVRPATAAQQREHIHQSCQQAAAHGEVYDDPEAFADSAPGLVIECAGQAAVAEYGELVLTAGLPLVVSSVGALGDAGLHARLLDCARQSRSQLIISSGAIGALDIVSGLQLAGIHSARYRSRKPPTAWRGTPAADQLDLENLSRAVAFFDGTARDAVREYPKNTNVAAALALAGIGFDATTVQLIADPTVSGNRHEFDVDSVAGSVCLQVEGRVSPENPKTSLPTVYSLAREVLNRVRPLVV